MQSKSSGNSGCNGRSRIAGGCDVIPPPYEPTPEDWASYHAWAEEVDRRRTATQLGIVSRDFAERLAYGPID